VFQKPKPNSNRSFSNAKYWNSTPLKRTQYWRLVLDGVMILCLWLLVLVDVITLCHWWLVLNGVVTLCHWWLILDWVIIQEDHSLIITFQMVVSLSYKLCQYRNSIYYILFSTPAAWSVWRPHHSVQSQSAMQCLTCRKSETVPRQTRFRTMEMHSHTSKERSVNIVIWFWWIF